MAQLKINVAEKGQGILWVTAPVKSVSEKFLQKFHACSHGMAGSPILLKPQILLINIQQSNEQY
jgi:hypothetical protein